MRRLGAPRQRLGARPWSLALLPMPLLLAALGWMLWPGSDTARQRLQIAAVSAAVTLDHQPALVGQRIAPGSTLRCAENAELQLVDSDGSTVTAGGGTILRIGDPSGGLDLRCERGRLICVVQQQTPETPLLIHTPHGALRVIGTRFNVEVDRSTRLRVESGSVEIVDNGDGRQQVVTSGGEAEVFALGLHQPLPMPDRQPADPRR
jgi:ferric-dicitrate binding protein FerR (iron transport regulator)